MGAGIQEMTLKGKEMRIGFGKKTRTPEQEQFRADANIGLQGELRVTAWMIIAINALLAIEDLFVFPDQLIFQYILKLFMVLISLTILILLRSEWGKRHIETIALAGIVGLAPFALMTVWGIEAPYIIPIIAAFIAAVSAGMLSWRIEYHYAMVGISILLILSNTFLFFEQFGLPLARETIASLVLSCITILIAQYSQKRRFTLWQTRRALAESEVQFRQFAESSKDIIFIWLPDRSMQYVSPVYQKYLRKPGTSEIRNWRWVLRFVHPDDRRELTQGLMDVNNGQQRELNLRLCHIKNKTIYLEGWGTPVFNQEGEVIRCIGSWRDVTERVEMMKHLDEISITDPLTKIYNRRFFFDEIEKEDQRSKGSQAAVILFDIDHFKQVNDTWGHMIGDQVLVHITKVCQQLLRKEDVFARYGGEEFVVLLSETDDDAVHATAERLREEIAAFPLKLGETNEIGVTISLGVSSWTPQDEHTITDILQQADKALYKSKQAGRNRVTVW